MTNDLYYFHYYGISYGRANNLVSSGRRMKLRKLRIKIVRWLVNEDRVMLNVGIQISSRGVKIGDTKELGYFIDTHTIKNFSIEMDSVEMYAKNWSSAFVFEEGTKFNYKGLDDPICTTTCRAAKCMKVKQ